jgi:hypothetical protein
MAHTVTITIVTAEQSFPAGTVSAGIKVKLGDKDQTITAAPYVATFEGVEPGDYNIQAETIDSVGNSISNAITGTVTVAPDVVNIDVPASLSVLVS